MKKTIAIASGLVLLGAAIACGVAAKRPRELVFQGKPVSAWAFQLYGPVERDAAAVVFKELGERAVPDLVRMLRTRDPLLAKPLYPPPDWLPRPLQLLIRRTIRPTDASSRRLVAAHAVAALGPRAADAVPALGLMFNGGTQDERWVAATALGHIRTAAAVQICVAALRGTNLNLHHPAVYALGEMGTNALPALPEILACLGHPWEAVRDSAGYTLSQVGKPALEPLVERVRTRRGVERRAAAQALARLWPPPRVGLPPLLEMLADPEPESRLQALAGVMALAPWHKDVAAALTHLIGDPGERVRTAATGAPTILPEQSEAAGRP